MFEQDQLDNPTEICNCSQHLFDEKERAGLAKQSAPEQHASILSRIVKRLSTPRTDLEKEEGGSHNPTSVQDWVTSTHPIASLDIENPISSRHPLAEKYQQHKALTQELGQHTAQGMATRASRRRHLPEQYSEDREWGESPEGMSTLSDWNKEDSLHRSKTLGLKSRLGVLEQDLKELPQKPKHDLESHIAFHAAGAGIDKAKEIMGMSDSDLEERPSMPEITRRTTTPEDIFQKKIPVSRLSITTGPSTAEVLDTILKGKTREPRIGKIMLFNEKYANEYPKKKEAGLADIPHNIVTHLPTLIPTVAAEAGLLTGLVKNIKNRKKPDPTPGSQEAYRATGFMSPSEIEDYKNKDAVGTTSSFDKKYTTEKNSSALIQHAPLISEIAKGVGHVLKDTFMEPENAVKSVGHFVKELATGQGAPQVDTKPGHYYDSAPLHLTPTEVGAPGAAYLINKSKNVLKSLMPKGKHEAAKKVDKPPMCLDCGRKTSDCKGKFDCRQFVLEKARGADPHQMDIS